MNWISLPAPTEPAKIKEPGTEQSRQHSPKNTATSDSDTGKLINSIEDIYLTQKLASFNNVK